MSNLTEQAEAFRICRLEVDSVIPAEAGIQNLNRKRTWTPAFAGMTNFHFA